MNIQLTDLPSKYQKQAEEKLGRTLSKPPQKQPQNKYQNSHIEINGIRFPSIKEGNRYHELWLMEREGEISDLRLQEEFVIQNAYRRPEDGKKVAAIKYLADFTYTQNGLQIIEDAKGIKTPVYKLKKKLLAKQGIEIKEV